VLCDVVCCINLVIFCVYVVGFVRGSGDEPLEQKEPRLSALHDKMCYKKLLSRWKFDFLVLNVKFSFSYIS
jgi:hypothetical protein